MTASAPSDVRRRLRDLELREVRAWLAYRDEGRGLTGAEYEAVEEQAWERLTDELADVDRERRLIIALTR